MVLTVPPRTQGKEAGKGTAQEYHTEPVREKAERERLQEAAGMIAKPEQGTSMQGEAAPAKPEQERQKGAEHTETPASETQAQEGEETDAPVDAVLCADDLTPDAAEWQKDIAGFYQKNDNPELRAHVLRIFYRGDGQELYNKRQKVQPADHGG